MPARINISTKKLSLFIGANLQGKKARNYAIRFCCNYRCVTIQMSQQNPDLDRGIMMTIVPELLFQPHGILSGGN